jgi:hypothetical protein
MPRTLSRALLLLLILLPEWHAVQLCSGDQLPSPPPIQTLQYKRLERWPHKQRTVEQLISADFQRTRVDVTIEDGDTTPPVHVTLVRIAIFDPQTGLTTEYMLQPQKMAGTRKRFEGHEEPIEGFTQEFYPDYWQRLLDAPQSGLRSEAVQRLSDEVVEGIPTAVYAWEDSALKRGYQWWLTMRDQMWIPVQYASTPRGGKLPDRILEVKINEPLSDDLWVIPSDYTITDVATDQESKPASP